MARAAADGQHAIDNLLSDTSYDLALSHTGKRLPEIVEAVKRRTSFGDGTPSIAFPFDQHGLGALTCRREGCHNAPRTRTGDDNIEVPDGQFLGWFFVVIAKVDINLRHIDRTAGLSPNSKYEHMF